MPWVLLSFHVKAPRIRSRFGSNRKPFSPLANILKASDTANKPQGGHRRYWFTAYQPLKQLRSQHGAAYRIVGRGPGSRPGAACQHLCSHRLGEERTLATTPCRRHTQMVDTHVPPPDGAARVRTSQPPAPEQRSRRALVTTTRKPRTGIHIDREHM